MYYVQILLLKNKTLFEFFNKNITDWKTAKSLVNVLVSVYPSSIFLKKEVPSTQNVEESKYSLFFLFNDGNCRVFSPDNQPSCKNLMTVGDFMFISVLNNICAHFQNY